jgi:NAD(P)-dependent dehydrogenase (short-subunit alcohol dehydrogenase family)
MVNNAGIAPDTDGLATQQGSIRVHEMQTASFDLTMSINTRGVFLSCKYALLQFPAHDPLPLNSRGDNTRDGLSIWRVLEASSRWAEHLATRPARMRLWD